MCSAVWLLLGLRADRQLTGAGMVSVIGTAHWFQWKHASLHCAGSGYDPPLPLHPKWCHFTSALCSRQRLAEGTGQRKACAKLFICLFKFFFFLNGQIIKKCDLIKQIQLTLMPTDRAD